MKNEASPTPATDEGRTEEYLRGYQAGYHAGYRAQLYERRDAEAKSDPAVAQLILSQRWPNARKGDRQSFGGRQNMFVFTGRSWQPTPKETP